MSNWINNRLTKMLELKKLILMKVMGALNSIALSKKDIKLNLLNDSIRGFNEILKSINHKRSNLNQKARKLLSKEIPIANYQGVIKKAIRGYTLKARFNEISRSIKHKRSNLNQKARKLLSQKISIGNYQGVIKKIISGQKLNKYRSSIKNYFNPSSLNNEQQSGKNKIRNDIQEDFIGIYYSDHKLLIIGIEKRKGKTFINNLVSIDIPGDLIGDFKVENTEEIAKIIKDVIEVFGLKNPPIILLLGSSYFTARTFKDNELVVFSEKDPTLLSKSPFLPLNTSIQYQRVSGNVLSSYHRVIYADKSAIESWISVLVITQNPIVALTSSSLHVVDYISKIRKDDLTILCDIENNATTVLLQYNNCELSTVKLPYGSSLYISNEPDIQLQYFDRLTYSIKKILEERSYTTSSKVYLTGSGLDSLISNNSILSSETERFPTSNSRYFVSNSDNVKALEASNQSILTSFSLITDEAIA